MKITMMEIGDAVAIASRAAKNLGF